MIRTIIPIEDLDFSGLELLLTEKTAGRTLSSEEESFINDVLRADRSIADGAEPRIGVIRYQDKYHPVTNQADLAVYLFQRRNTIPVEVLSLHERDTIPPEIHYPHHLDVPL